MCNSHSVISYYNAGVHNLVRQRAKFANVQCVEGR